MPIDYQKAKIYRITSDSAGLTYYGSTCQVLHMRLGGHRSDMRKWQAEEGGFTTSFSVLEHPDAVIVLVENYPCNNKDELNARERFHIEGNECVNKQFPGRTRAEYREANKEVIAEYKKQYYQENKEVILEKMAGKIQCSCGSSIRNDSKARHERSKKHQKYQAQQAQESEEHSEINE